MKFPVDELERFFERSSTAVYNAKRNSKRFIKTSRYEEVEDGLLAKMSNGEVHFFGSRIMGLANHYSDLDVYIDPNDSFYTGNPHYVAKKLIKEWEKKMKNDQDWDVKIALQKATVPVLRCVYLPKMLKCKF